MNHQPHTTRPPARRHARGGYTLIEILVAVAIITVLIGLTIGAYSGIRQSAARSKTKATLGVLKSAADELKVATGVVILHKDPGDITPAVSLDTLRAMYASGGPTGASVSGMHRFLWFAMKNETSKTMLQALGDMALRDTNSDGIPDQVLDAWDRPIEYFAYDDSTNDSNVVDPKPYFRSSGYSGNAANEEDNLYSYDLE